MSDFSEEIQYARSRGSSGESNHIQLSTDNVEDCIAKIHTRKPLGQTVLEVFFLKRVLIKLPIF